jgi:membrane-bound ClpP family serine protease
MFCDDLDLIAPGKCMSAGTLIALGANRIIMTKQATLGPIDPSIQSPLNPSIPGATPDARAPVSVEAVNGYLEAVRRIGNGEMDGTLVGGF